MRLSSTLCVCVCLGVSVSVWCVCVCVCDSHPFTLAHSFPFTHSHSLTSTLIYLIISLFPLSLFLSYSPTTVVLCVCVRGVYGWGVCGLPLTLTHPSPPHSDSLPNHPHTIAHSVCVLYTVFDTLSFDLCQCPLTLFLWPFDSVL